MKKVKLYADGACRGNAVKDNLGGYGAVLLCDQHVKEIKFATQNTTNNIMELTGVLEGLRTLKEPCMVEVYSDSAYLVNAFQQKWLASWQNNGWKTSKKEPVKNQALWQALLDLTKIHQVTFHKVKGHSDDIFNNRCDALANEAMDELLQTSRES